nr:MAG TPA: hypothetical protein [Caudoviricetes sp.]
MFLNAVLSSENGRKHIDTIFYELVSVRLGQKYLKIRLAFLLQNSIVLAL